jgi:fucose 4-O-acetylase-like acetyltransferase
LSAGWQNFVFRWNDINAYVWLYAQKWTVGPLRVILFLLWFTALFMLVNKYIEPINRYSRNLFLLLGQNGLFVYIAHAFIVFIFKLFISAGHPLLVNFLVTAAALFTLVAVTKIYTRIPPHRRPELSFRRRLEPRKT